MATFNASDQPEMILTYLDIEGLAEPIRLAFDIGSVKYVDRRVGYDDIARLRECGELPFGQVPVLQLKNGAVHSQTGSLLRYAGYLSGLYPCDQSARCMQPAWCLTNEETRLRVDTVLETIADIQKSLIPLWYKHALGRHPLTGGFFEGTALTAEQQVAATTAVNEVLLPTRLAQLEHLLDSWQYSSDDDHDDDDDKEQRPYICADDMTIADVSLMVLLRGLINGTYCDGVQLTYEYLQSNVPLLYNLLSAVEKIPEVKARAQRSE